ncbi:uncharacterized protein LOC111359585 [Spodoptera litura]|uniref:Uncharacterized protein LOC111359585 n=1 Tax=Spodoptera litura TaxID=69820 RepID=A0A9J7EMZ3_SPOLT|nr:uncharacterized protein LOC111359585 [Spodoptera litura]
MINTTEAGDSNVTEEQAAAATLRELFLKAFGELNGKPCSILTYEKTTLNAVFAAWHPDGSEIIVRNLQTPACFTMSTALLRTPDVLAIKFDQPVQLP